jgi:hypothetical protein
VILLKIPPCTIGNLPNKIVNKYMVPSEFWGLVREICIFFMFIFILV